MPTVPKRSICSAGLVSASAKTLITEARRPGALRSVAGSDARHGQRGRLLGIKAAGYKDTQLVEISLAMAVITFTNVFNRINDTTLDYPAAA